MPELTPSQQKALSTKRHLAITANAGSGKTRVLVERFVKLFEDDTDLTVQNVVAITFTENAAAELRKKILNEVKERLAGLPPGDIARRARLIAVRDGLPSAFVMTIHSFASRMLKAYPVEANVDASYGIVEGADERLLREESIDRICYSSLDEAYDQTEESDILHLFRSLGRHEVKNLLRTMLSHHSRTVALREHLLQASDEQIIASWHAEAERILAYPERAREVISDLRAAVKGGVRGQEIEPLFLAFESASGTLDIAIAFAELVKLLLTKEGNVHSQRIDLKRVSADLEVERAELLHYVECYKSLLDSLPETGEAFDLEHREYLRLMRAALHLADLAEQEYASDKASYGLLDYDDLLLRFRKLLQDAAVRNELAEKLRFIMIDEYQDTDEVQFELARLLSQEFRGVTNVMVVGDPKQSIYSFRNANVAIFHATREQIALQPIGEAGESESLKLSLGPTEEQGLLALGESFRMAIHPLASINRMFASIMQPERGVLIEALEVEYSDLIHGRPSEATGSVEWICPWKPGKHDSEDEDTSDGLDESLNEEATEADLIARKILFMMGSESYSVEDKEGPRAPRYEDVAILLRSRTNLGLIERALRDAGIPYVVAKGAGFYEQPEILDAANYLSFLVSPDSDLPLIGILRSPFFALSDVDLYKIASQGTIGESFWQKLCRYATLAEAQNNAPLQRAVEQLERNLILAGRTGASFLLEKIYAETGIYAILGARADGRQRIANLEKFLTQARASDASGFASLYEFVERVQYLIDESEKESQADAVAVEGAVQIMTVHAAKGLEFPIVFLPFLQKQFNLDTTGLIEPDLGLLMRNADEERQPFIAALLRARARARAIAEEKRIFYVAATRARDHLVLCATLPKNSPKNSWLTWAADVYPGIYSGENSIRLEERYQRYDSVTRETTERTCRFDIPLARTLEDIPFTLQRATGATAEQLGELMLTPMTRDRAMTRYSATQLLRYQECPTKYHLSYLLGLPEEARLAYDLGADELSESVRGQTLGQLVHKLFDKIDRITVSGHLGRDKFEHELDKVFWSLGIVPGEQRRELAEMSQRHIETFLASDLAQEVLASVDARTEFSLQARVGEHRIFYGIIDRLYRDAAGTWTILDYKTERRGNPPRDAKNTARHQFQLQFYAKLVGLLYPDAERIRCLLFYTHSGEIVESLHEIAENITFERTCNDLITLIERDSSVSDLTLLERNEDHCAECKFFSERTSSCIVLASSEAERHASEIPDFA